MAASETTSASQLTRCARRRFSIIGRPLRPRSGEEPARHRFTAYPIVKCDRLTGAKVRPDTSLSRWRRRMMHAPANNAELRESKKQMVSGAYLHNAWYVAAWSDDLADGQLLARTILKEPVVLYRKADGHVAALQDRCPHRFAPLSMGKIVHGDCLQCPYHGLEFDASGACTLNPHGTKNIPPRARVRSYPVTEKHKAIWIWMG